MIAHRSSQLHEAIESMMTPPHYAEPIVVADKGVRKEAHERVNNKLPSSLLHLDLG